MNKKIKNCIVGKNTIINDFVNLYDCTIGDNCTVGTFVEIQKDVSIGNFVKIESHTFIPTGVMIEDNVFIGHHVVFTNDKYPRSVNPNGKSKKEGDWKLQKTVIKKGASIGSNATILGGVEIGENAIIGAGSIIAENVNASEVYTGKKAKRVRKL